MKGIISAILLIFIVGQLVAQEDGKFTSLKEALKNPTAVKELQLSGIKEKLPKELAKMVNLESVRLINLKSNYNLNHAFKTLEKYTNIKQLHLYGNKHEKLPKSLAEIESLEYIRLSSSMKNDVENIFDFLSEIKGLTSLSLEGMNLKSIPLNIKNLNLKYLSIGGNQISIEQAIDIASFFELEELDLSWYKFSEIPENITALKSVRKLTFEWCSGGFNNAASYERLSQLPNLAELNIEGNFTGMLHENIKLLKQLDHLFISGNCISPEGTKTLQSWLPNTEIDNKIPC